MPKKKCNVFFPFYLTIYQARRFRQRLDYYREPEGPLTRQDKATIKEIVASSGI